MRQAIVLVLDAIPFRCLGCYGNDWIETPTIDQLAHDGVAFDFCFAESPGAGAWMRYGLSGISALEAMEPELQSDLLRSLAAQGIATGWLGDSAEMQVFARQIGFESASHVAALDAWESVRREAIDWVGRHADRPFLLWLQLSFTGDWQTPAPFHDRYIESEESPVDLSLTDLQELTPEQLPALQGTLAGRVAYLDHWLGALRGDLAKAAGDREMAWVFTADQGFPLGEHGTTGLAELTLYDERVHVPALVQVPGGRRTYRSPGLFQPVDLWPTLVDLFEVDLEKPSANAFSILSIVRGEPSKQREYACLTADDQILAIRTHNWKLILPLEPIDIADTLAPELYVKPEDCWDTHDVAEAHPGITDRLELQLRRHQDAARRGTLAWVPPLQPTQLIADHS